MKDNIRLFLIFVGIILVVIGGLVGTGCVIIDSISDMHVNTHSIAYMIMKFQESAVYRGAVLSIIAGIIFIGVGNTSE